ncbi:MAG: alpha-mannosidase [Bacteroidales bacterium]|nr:alpha-mannosidase [Bacteroidales bacterium]
MIIAVLAFFPAYSQGERYFVDGFHGGVYGHYPLDSYTDYMMSVLKENPEWAFGLEIEPETWDSVKVHTPQAYKRFVSLLGSDSRVEYTNPTYAQPYMFNITGESVIRQFELGIRKLRSHFPGISFSTYAVEEPCFTSCLPMILSGFGFRYASLKNPNTCWGGYMAPFGGELVRWVSKDGSSVVASPRHSFESLGDNVYSTISNGRFPEYFEKADSAGFPHPVGFTYQDAGWRHGPWMTLSPEMSENIRYVTWTEYFESVSDGDEIEDHPADQEDVRAGLMWGTQVMQNLARSVRNSENLLLSAEKMGAMARWEWGWSGEGLGRKTSLDEAWRNLLLAQHHDCWIVPFNFCGGLSTWADRVRDEWTHNADEIALRYFRRASLSGVGEPSREVEEPRVRLYNTLGVPRSEVVSIALSSEADRRISVYDASGSAVNCWDGLVDGVHTLVFRAEVPAFGYRTYSLSLSSKTPEKTVCRRVRKVENGMYRLVFNARKGGTVRKLIDKRTGRNLVDAASDFAFGELKGYFYDEGRFISSAMSPATVTLVEDNEFEKKIRICGTIAGHPFTETLTLKEDDPVIDVSLTVLWQANVGIGAYRQDDADRNPERACYDDRYHLNIYFPVRGDGASLFKNAPFDVCKSSLESTAFHNWKDIKHNIITEWLDLEMEGGPSLALLNDHTTSYVNRGDGLLGLTVQYSGNGLWNEDYTISGPTELHFAIVPHEGGWETAEMESRLWNEPLKACLWDEPALKIWHGNTESFSWREIPLKDASIMDLSGSGWELSAARIEGDGVMVRLYNSFGDSSEKSVILPGSVASAFETDLLGNVIASAKLEKTAEGSVLKASIPRFGIKTFILK